MEIPFGTLSEFIDAIKTLSSEWGVDRGNIWYRGLEDERLGLVPGTVWRGIDLETEESMVAEFLVYYRSYYHREPAHALELYALMRHYGLPTRLLDWSMSALVSLFFALERSSGGEGRRVVWAMDHVELNRITLNQAVSVVPRGGGDDFTARWLPKMLRSDTDDEIPHNVFAFKHPMSNQRINAQKGCFTFHGRSERGIDDVFREAGSPRIAKLVLMSAERRMDVLNELFDLGFKEDDIYQDLNALTRRIMREHGCASDAAHPVGP
jgi:hypothetical protein